MTVDELRAQLKSSGYTTRSEAELRSAAEQQYKSQYDANTLAAQQSFDKSDLALKNQYAGLEKSYADQTDKATAATKQSYSAADRGALSRGMQRSSYTGATLANINIAGEKTLNGIAQNKTNDFNTLDTQRSQLAEQLAAQLSGYSSQYQSDVLARMDQMRQEDYEKKVAAEQYANSVAMQLYQLEQTDRQIALQQAAAAGRSGGGRSSRTPSPTPDTNTGGSLFSTLGLNIKGTVGSTTVSPSKNPAADRIAGFNAYAKKNSSVFNKNVK